MFLRNKLKHCTKWFFNNFRPCQYLFILIDFLHITWARKVHNFEKIVLTIFSNLFYPVNKVACVENRYKTWALWVYHVYRVIFIISMEWWVYASIDFTLWKFFKKTILKHWKFWLHKTWFAQMLWLDRRLRLQESIPTSR